MEPKKPQQKCKTCGLEAGASRDDGTEVKFWPTRPHECTECTMAARKNSRVGVTKYTCEIHGPHTGTQVGLSWSKNCPQCQEQRRQDGLEAHRGVIAGAREMITKHPWLDEWMAEEAERMGLSNKWEALALAVADGIPAEWFKAAALKK